MIVKTAEEWFYDNIRFEIPFYNQTIITETLRLFYERMDCSPHWHTSYELHIITDGRVSYSIDGHEDIVVEKNELLLIPPDAIHSERLLTPSHGIAFAFQFLPQKTPAAFLPEVQKEVASLLHAYQSCAGRYYFRHDCRRIIELFDDAYGELKERHIGALITVQNLLTQVLVELFRMMNKELPVTALPKKRVEDDVSFIVSNYFQLDSDRDPSQLSLKELAALMCLSERQVSRYLLKTYHKTFVELLNESKVSYAKFLLVKTDKDVGEIAEKCGWSDKYFYYRFKEIAGTSPMKYRKLRKD